MRGINMLVIQDLTDQVWPGAVYVANLYSRDMVDYWKGIQRV